ncbi:MAG: YveK family protein [Oscillospiraceae bacterium]
MTEYLKAIGKRWVGILVFTLVATMIFTGLEFFIFPRLYRAGAQLYVRVNTGTQSYDTPYTDLQAGDKFINDYMAIVTSEAVLKKVVMNLQDSYPQINDPSVINLEKNFMTEMVPQTRVFWVYVTTTQPELSAAVANEVARTLVEADKEITGYNNLYILATSSVPSQPLFPKYTRDIPICAGAALLLAVAVALFLDYLSRSKQQKDVSISVDESENNIPVVLDLENEKKRIELEFYRMKQEQKAAKQDKEQVENKLPDEPGTGSDT